MLAMVDILPSLSTCSSRKILAWNAATAKGVVLVMTRSEWPPGNARTKGIRRARTTDRTRRRGLARDHDPGSPSNSSSKASGPSIGRPGTRSTTPRRSVIGLYKTECARTTVFHDGPYRNVTTSNAPPPAGSTGTPRKAAQHPRLPDPGRVRASPRCGHQPRAGTRVGVAENLGRFNVTFPRVE